MPIDREWQKVTITGTYPATRFFSLALYDDAPVATELADHLFDAQIAPDPGGINPFASEANATDEPRTYTVTVTRSQDAGNNTLNLNAETGWLLYRVYLPNAGAGGMGGVPLPAIAITDSRGESSPLPACEYVNRRSELMAVQSWIVPELVASRYGAVEYQFGAQDGDRGDLIAHAARLADLAVLGGYRSEGWQILFDATLFRSGRPALVVPRHGVTERQFHRVLFAWKETKEAARAVAAAQPFLLRAEVVRLITVGEGEGEMTSLREVEQYLQLHHSEVRSEALPPTGQPISDTLFGRAVALGGALLVMGAYRHYRWREQVFGGVTESALREPRTPILMAH